MTGMTNRRASYLARLGLRRASGFASLVPVLALPRSTPTRWETRAGHGAGRDALSGPQHLTQLYGLGPVKTYSAVASLVPARNLRKAGLDISARGFGLSVGAIFRSTEPNHE